MSLRTNMHPETCHYERQRSSSKMPSLSGVPQLSSVSAANLQKLVTGVAAPQIWERQHLLIIQTDKLHSRQTWKVECSTIGPALWQIKHERLASAQNVWENNKRTVASAQDTHCSIRSTRTKHFNMFSKLLCFCWRFQVLQVVSFAFGICIWPSAPWSRNCFASRTALPQPVIWHNCVWLHFVADTPLLSWFYQSIDFLVETINTTWSPHHHG